MHIAGIKDYLTCPMKYNLIQNEKDILVLMDEDFILGDLVDIIADFKDADEVVFGNPVKELTPPFRLLLEWFSIKYPDKFKVKILFIFKRIGKSDFQTLEYVLPRTNLKLFDINAYVENNLTNNTPTGLSSPYACNKCIVKSKCIYFYE